MSTANTHDCIRGLIGKTIVGVLFNALPTNRRDLASGNKTLVFEDGTGFTFSSKGTFWSETATDIARAVNTKHEELRLVEQDIRDVLVVAGVTDDRE